MEAKAHSDWIPNVKNSWIETIPTFQKTGGNKPNHRQSKDKIAHEN